MYRIWFVYSLLVLRVRSNGVLEFELLSFYDADRRLLSSQGVPECCSPSFQNTTDLCEKSCINEIIPCRLRDLSEEHPKCLDDGEPPPDPLPAFTTQPDKFEDRGSLAVMQEHYFSPQTKIIYHFTGEWKNQSFQVYFYVYQKPISRELATFRWTQLNALALAKEDTSRVLINMASFRPNRWLAVRARVTCDEYYYLLNCSVYCKPTDGSSGHYTCDSNGNKKCIKGWYDPSSHCVKMILYCDSNPCQHHATCKNILNGFICECEHGYTGVVCETEINYCLSHPCQNGGTCKPVLGSYVCSCQPGYTGVSCETEIDFCLSNPCLNGGTCNPKLNSYTCTCREYYYLANCLVYCKPTDDVNGHYTCDSKGNKKCLDGYYEPSSNCTKMIPYCDSNPCQHQATCQNIFKGFVCECAHGYTGHVCDSEINYCLSDPCHNNGTCKPLFGSYVCFCSTGYTGASCRTEINFCRSNPCLNGGTCHPKPNAYTCTCPKHHKPPRCYGCMAKGSFLGAALVTVIVILLTQ